MPRFGSAERRAPGTLLAAALLLAACAGPVGRDEIEEAPYARSAEFAADYEALYECFSNRQQPSGLLSDGRGFARSLSRSEGVAEFKHGFENRYYTLVRFRRVEAGRTEVVARAVGAADLALLWGTVGDCAAAPSEE